MQRTRNQIAFHSYEIKKNLSQTVSAQKNCFWNFEKMSVFFCQRTYPVFINRSRRSWCPSIDRWKFNRAMTFLIWPISDSVRAMNFQTRKIVEIWKKKNFDGPPCTYLWPDWSVKKSRGGFSCMLYKIESRSTNASYHPIGHSASPPWKTHTRCTRLPYGDTKFWCRWLSRRRLSVATRRGGHPSREADPQ